MTKEQGFKWLELAIVLVVLAILAAIAVPKFRDLTLDARNNAIKAVATSLSAANTANLAVRKKDPKKGVPILNCLDVANALQGDKLAAEYSIVGAPVADGKTVSCVVKGPKETQASFTATGIK